MGVATPHYEVNIVAYTQYLAKFEKLTALNYVDYVYAAIFRDFVPRPYDGSDSRPSTPDAFSETPNFRYKNNPLLGRVK